MTITNNNTIIEEADLNKKGDWTWSTNKTPALTK